MGIKTTTSAIALALAAAACRPPPHPAMPCSVRARAEGPALAAATSTPASVWFDLLAPDHGQARDPFAQIHECSGRPLDGGPAPESRILPHRPPGVVDLSFAAAPGGDLLVWARVVHYDDGDALGPIALLHRHENHLEVTAVGSLRAPAEAVALRMEHPDGGAAVVIAEGDRCVRPDECVREAQLLPLLGHRFIPIGIAGESDEPQPARVALEELATEPLADGWTREIETSRSVALRGAVLVISEATRIRECPRGLVQACDEQRGVHREIEVALTEEAFVPVQR